MLARAPFRIFMLGLAMLLPVLKAQAQAWPQPDGHLYTKFSLGHTDASRQFAFDGEETAFINGVNGNAFKDRSLYFYGEYGLTDAVTLVLSLPYKRTFIRDQAFRYRTFAFGTATAGVRVGLLPLLGQTTSANSLSANLALSIPTGYTRNFAPSAGSGQVDAQAMIHYGRSLYPFPGYVQIGTGYRYRSSIYAFSQAVPCSQGSEINCMLDQQPAYGNELVYSFEGGVSPLGGTLLIQLLGNGVWSVQEPMSGFTAINPIPARQRYLKLGGGLAVYPFRLAGRAVLQSFGLSVQYFRTISGRNTIKGRDLFIGLEYQLGS